jgi:hypothetical protein
MNGKNATRFLLPISKNHHYPKNYFSEYLIHFNDHFDLFYCVKSTILLNTLYLQINL